MMENFIKTSDKETIELLESLGFKVLSRNGGVVTFLNDTSIANKFEKQKIVYTNKIEL